MAERLYLLQAVRYVTRVVPMNASQDINALPETDKLQPGLWVDEKGPGNDARRAYCSRYNLEHHVLPASAMQGFPEPPPTPSAPGRKKVIATGCYDWFHSGHVRFCEEANTYGDLYVIVGHDANIRLLKGEGHPLFPQDERRYAVGSIKYVKQALITSGEGWMDADPEIRRLKPDIYVVNEDGDKGGKRDYCAKMGIKYLVLKRTPAPGLLRRTSTNLRGF
jgi:cytidyltransferase-like protein